MSVPGNSTKEFTITLNNPNNRTARFNFYYVGTLASDLSAGYKTGSGINIPPEAKGINLEKSGTSGSSNTYKIRVSNNTSGSKTITLGVEVGLDYNDLTLPSNGHLFSEYEGIEVYKVLLNDSLNGINQDINGQSFITSSVANNYIWYSGKLWRAVSIDTTDNSVKVITDENISTISYNNGSSSFDDSGIKKFLNDESTDGFLSNLREPQNFIKMDSEWKQNPDWVADAVSPVGLLSSYEFENSYTTATSNVIYLNNNSWWWLLTSGSSYGTRYVINNSGELYLEIDGNVKSYGVRPVVNLKSTVKVVDGDGTLSKPYRLKEIMIVV